MAGARSKRYDDGCRIGNHLRLWRAAEGGGKLLHALRARGAPAVPCLLCGAQADRNSRPEGLPLVLSARGAAVRLHALRSLVRRRRRSVSRPYLPGSRCAELARFHRPLCERRRQWRALDLAGGVGSRQPEPDGPGPGRLEQRYDRSCRDGSSWEGVRVDGNGAGRSVRCGVRAAGGTRGRPAGRILAMLARSRRHT